jgi:hypothetical protein
MYRFNISLHHQNPVNKNEMLILECSSPCTEIFYWKAHPDFPININDHKLLIGFQLTPHLIDIPK